MNGSIFDVGLIGQIIRRLYGNLHPLNGQEGRQIGRVGGNYYQSEGPPVRLKQGR